MGKVLKSEGYPFFKSFSKYKKYARVIDPKDNGNLYKSLRDNNIWHEPKDSPDYWDILNPEYPSEAIEVEVHPTSSESTIQFLMQYKHGERFLMKIDWGDGNITTHSSHTYTSFKKHVCKIYLIGTLTRIRFNDDNGMKDNNTLLRIIKFPAIYSDSLTDISSMCVNCKTLTSVCHIVTKNVTNFTSAFSRCGSLATVSDFNTDKATNLTAIFHECSKLTSNIILSNTSKCKYFTSAFSRCKLVTSISHIDASSGTRFYQMYESCSKLTSVSISNTYNGTDFRSMFMGCGSLTTIPELDTSNGTRFSRMYIGCYKVATFPNINTSNCTDFTSMYESCYAMKIAPTIDTSKGTTAFEMFQDCHILTTIHLLNCAKMTSVEFIVENCKELTSIKLNGVRYRTDVKHCKLSKDALNALFTSLGTAHGTQDIFITGNPGAATCNQSIAANKGWTVKNTLPIVLTVDISHANDLTYEFETTNPEKYTIYWGDDNCTEGENKHIYDEAGTYEISIYENVPSSEVGINSDDDISFSETDINMLLEVKELPSQYTKHNTSLSNMFKGCKRLNKLPDTIDSTSCEDGSNMFESCHSLNAIPIMNTSKVKTFTNMFKGCYLIKDIPKLDMSSGVEFKDMFVGCEDLANIIIENCSTQIDLSNCNLNSTTLNNIYKNLKLCIKDSKVINVEGNPGIYSDNPSIAEAKGWIVEGSTMNNIYIAGGEIAGDGDNSNYTDIYLDNGVSLCIAQIKSNGILGMNIPLDKLIVGNKYSIDHNIIFGALTSNIEDQTNLKIVNLNARLYYEDGTTMDLGYKDSNLLNVPKRRTSKSKLSTFTFTYDKKAISIAIKCSLSFDGNGTLGVMYSELVFKEVDNG